MTMPEKIYAMKDRSNGTYGNWDCAGLDDLGRKHAYIRADIAEELAQVLEAERDILKFYHADHDMVDAALTRFRAIEKGA